MLDMTINLSEFEDIRRAFNSVPDAVEEGIKEATALLRKLAEGNTPFDTGRLKGSWSSVQQDIGTLSYSFSTDVPYATVLEEGLYEFVGPRTVLTSYGIFSRQAPSGILWPLIEEEDSLQLIIQTVVHAIRQGIQRHVGA